MRPARNKAKEVIRSCIGSIPRGQGQVQLILILVAVAASANANSCEFGGTGAGVYLPRSRRGIPGSGVAGRIREVQASRQPWIEGDAMGSVFQIIHGIRGFSARFWNGFALVILLSVAATVPVVQLASLGYMLESSGRIARGLPANRWFPGAAIAGSLLVRSLWIGLTWLPVWLLADLAYSAELIEPGSQQAVRLRLVARFMAIAWVLWSAWALFRGGRWWHFLWPAPIVLVKTIAKGESWRRVEDRWWSWIGSLQFLKLLKLGFFGTVAAIVWLFVPAALMIIALTSPEKGPLGLIGLAGALSMWWVLMYLPFLPVHMASEGRFLAAFDRRGIRSAFRRSPFAFLIAVLGLVVLALPLYVLRIEAIPPELWWVLSVFFVALIFPAKLLAGWAIRRSQQRKRESHWTLRWLAWLPLATALGLYVGFLYLAKFALWEGAASILLQHAFLPPVPFYVR